MNIGELNPDGSVDAGKNIGNIAKQTITVPGLTGVSGFTATQTYAYDALERLKTAEEQISGVTNWKQAFDYDIYGNRSI